VILDMPYEVVVRGVPRRKRVEGIFAVRSTMPVDVPTIEAEADAVAECHAPPHNVGCFVPYERGGSFEPLFVHDGIPLARVFRDDAVGRFGVAPFGAVSREMTREDWNATAADIAAGRSVFLARNPTAVESVGSVAKDAPALRAVVPDAFAGPTVRDDEAAMARAREAASFLRLRGGALYTFRYDLLFCPQDKATGQGPGQRLVDTTLSPFEIAWRYGAVRQVTMPAGYRAARVPWCGMRARVPLDAVEFLSRAIEGLEIVWPRRTGSQAIFGSGYVEEGSTSDELFDAAVDLKRTMRRVSRERRVEAGDRIALRTFAEMLHEEPVALVDHARLRSESGINSFFKAMKLEPSRAFWI
jgi:hypothetical protein